MEINQIKISQIQDRLSVLRNEHAAGETQLRVLDARKSELQQTLLRIAGAIQVLEEMESEMKAEQGK